MKRNDIPSDISAKVLFLSNRTCCVCRVKGKPIQIHHIDGNSLNNDLRNLAVLCLDCHNETQISGGFGRKLSPEQVILYRDDWIALVTRERASALVEEDIVTQNPNLEQITTTIEIYKENKQYVLLAMLFDSIHNYELRDKYIELSLQKQQDPQLEIYFRSRQGKIETVDNQVIEGEVNRRKKNEDWSQLARLYKDIGDYENAIKYYCKSILSDLEEGNLFSAAFYLKELSQSLLHKPIFEKTYKQYSDKNNLWWQIRSLEELGWESELRELILSKQKDIEDSGDLHLLRMLYEIKDDKKKLSEISKRIVESTRLGKISNEGEFVEL